MDKDRKGTILALISASTFGTEAIIVKILYSFGINTMTLLTFRFTFAIIFLWFFVIYKKESFSIPKNNLKKILFVGIFIFPLTSAFLVYSFNFVPAPVAIMCLYTYPVFVTIWSVFFLQERLTRQKIISLLIALLGLILVIGIPSGRILAVGIVFALLAALINSFVVIFNSKIVRNVEPIVVNVYYLTCSAITYILIGFLSGKLSININLVELIYLIILAVLSTVIPHISLLKALKLTEASKVSITGMIEPVVTTLLAGLILNEFLTGIQIVGGLMILFGVGLLQIKFKNKKAKNMLNNI